jgi:aldehyde:ferredoxin oxidoreductase
MNSSFGWKGTIIRVNLTKGKVVKQSLPEEWKRLFLGGLGINAWILYNEVGSEVKPFDPENKVIFGTGPLSGTASPSSNRGIFTAKSPITGVYGAAHVGGFFPAELKLAGYDHIIIEGKSKKPVYLNVDDENVELETADHIWKKDTLETTKIIQEGKGEKVRVACIGPAGENLVRGACVIVDSFHAAGYGGIGAVLGSKKLKAIALQGTKNVEIADPDRFKAACKNVRDRHKAHPAIRVFSIDGSSTFFDPIDEKTGLVPQEAEDRFSKIFWDTVWENSSACYNCTIACRKNYLIKDGPHAGKGGEGYDFGALGLGHTLFPTSSKYGLDPNKTYNFLHELTKYGVDSHFFNLLFGWVMQLYDKGIITSRDTDGIQLRHGDETALLEMLDNYANRKGFGNILADGYLRVAEEIGEAMKYVPPLIKNYPFTLAPSLPRYGYILALAHSVWTGGTQHMKGVAYSMMKRVPLDQRVKVANELAGVSNAFEWWTIDGKASLLFIWENLMSILDSVGICKFASNYLWWGTIGFNEIAELLSSATGFKYDVNNLMETGERVNLIERAFNVREGIVGRKHDTIPAAISEQYKIDKEKFDMMLNEYYSLRGCEKTTGIPTKNKLDSIGLRFVSDDLMKRGIDLSK